LIGFPSITSEEEKQIQNLLNECTVVSLSNDIKKKYAELRRLHGLKLADALVAATAIVQGLPLITADKQFKKLAELNLIAYEA